jgi:hypothetical protein
VREGETPKKFDLVGLKVRTVTEAEFEEIHDRVKNKFKREKAEEKE